MTPKKTGRPVFSVIIPCYNEVENIPLILRRFAEVLAESDLKGKTEVIIVDNNSKDNTENVLKKELRRKEYGFARTVFQPIPGYGAAIWKGLGAAKGEYLCWTHGDIQTDPNDTLRAHKLIGEQRDPERCYVKGSRKGRLLFDIFFTIGMSCFETLLFQQWLWDINAQPNLFHRSFLKRLANPPADFSFDLYCYYTAKRNGFRIIRFPVLFTKRLHGASSWNTGLAAKWRFIRRTIGFSFRLAWRLSSATRVT